MLRYLERTTYESVRTRVMNAYAAWSEKLELPLLLAYVDDLLVITESLAEMGELVGELMVLLEEAGLVLIHPGKSDALSTRAAVEDTFYIDGMSVKSKPYFSSYLSATLNRPVKTT